MVRRSDRRRVVLLAAQAFALGATVAWVLIPATAIFLDAYGPGRLPWTYLGAAGAGAASTAALGVALRRRPLAVVAQRVLSGFAFSLILAWAVLTSWSADWIAFALLVVVPILVPIGFMFVVGQASALLDVRALKAGYGRVVAGFACGFTGGGLAGPVLLGALGRTEHLLAFAAVAAGSLLAMVAATGRSFPTELKVIPDEARIGDEPTLGTLLRDKYVRLIVAFQFLSAIESQLLDFLVFDRAAGRYEGDELARFISRFTAIAYGADIVFLVLLAGLLLRRFGLRYGLTANSFGVLSLLAAIITMSLVSGAGATATFALVVAARVTDLVASDGTSRTSLSAAYQVVPTNRRLAAQAAVEGLAVPVAIGVSGVALLVVGALGATGGLVLPIMTALVVTAWAVVAVVLYRGYRVSLLVGLRQRALDPAALSIEEADHGVLDRLLTSDEDRDVRLGLDLMMTTGHPDLRARLAALVSDDRAGVRAAALEHLDQLDPPAARGVARGALDDPDPVVRAGAVRVVGRSNDSADVDWLTARLTDPAPLVRVATAAAASQGRNPELLRRVHGEIDRLATSTDPEDRALGAAMLAGLEEHDDAQQAVARLLLVDEDDRVRAAALAAVRAVEPEVVEAVVQAAGTRGTAAAAAEALARLGEEAMPRVDDALAHPHTAGRAHEYLVRACRAVGGPRAVAVLHRHVGHARREVGLAAMTALGALAEPSEGEDHHPSVREALDADLQHAAHLLHALVVFEAEPAAELLAGALRDELALVQRRVLAALSTRHGAEALSAVGNQLVQSDPRSHALALEWLDVSLAGPDRLVLALVEPGLPHEERARRLGRVLDVAPIGAADLLVDLIEDRNGRWRQPWLAACALHAAALLPGIGDAAIVAATARSASASADQDAEAIVGETLAGLRRRGALTPA